MSEKKSDYIIRKKVCQKTYEDVTEFYNYNEVSFKEFKGNFGIDIWFMNHFRTYMIYRNEKLYFTKKKKTKIKTYKLISRILQELIFILINYKPHKKKQSDYLIISNYSDQVNNKNIRFGKLELEFDNLHNRQLFDIKKPISSSEFLNNGVASSDTIFINYLLKLTFLKDLAQFHKGLKKLKQQIYKRESSSIDSKINTMFWKNKAIYYICFLRFNAFKKFLRSTNYKAILLSDENSPQQKVIQYAAKKSGIKVFAFQHGNIHELHPAYIYGNYNNKPLLPDITFCWGKFFKQLLIEKGGYLNSQLKNVGRIPPYRQESKLNHKLKGINNIALYASQPQRDEKIRHQLLKDIFISCKKLNSKYTLVIRPHPNEKTDEFFKSVSIEVDYNNFIIDRDSDLESHFRVCKLFIVAFSTVGTEFIPYFKPMLVLDYYKQDLVGYIKNGVGIPIRSQSELLKELSKPELKIDHSNYQSFIDKYYDTGEHILEKVKKYIYEN